MRSRISSLLPNLAFCFALGLVFFGAGTVREHNIEDKPYNEAIQTGLIGGGIIFVVTAGYVLVASRLGADDDGDAGTDSDS